VLRPEFDQLVTGQYLHIPELREKLKRQPGRRRSIIVDGIAVKTAQALARLTGVESSRVIDCESDKHDAGVFADVLTMGPNLSYSAPDPRTGGGQVILVLQGSMLMNGVSYSGRSAVAVTREENAVTFSSGESGLHALVLQYPQRGADAA
jgi:hypothetical protein